MPKLRIMDGTGDTTLEWPTTDYTQEEVEREFNRLVASGQLAYRVDSPHKSTHLRHFDPEAEEIIVHGPFAGG